VALAQQQGVPLEVMRDAALRDKEGNPVEIVGAVLDVLANAGA